MRMFPLTPPVGCTHGRRPQLPPVPTALRHLAGSEQPLPPLTHSSPRLGTARVKTGTDKVVLLQSGQASCSVCLEES